MLTFNPPKTLLGKHITPAQIDSEQQFLQYQAHTYFYEIIDNLGQIRNPIDIDSHGTYQVVDLTHDGIVRLMHTKLIGYQKPFAELEEAFHETCSPNWHLNDEHPFGQIYELSADRHFYKHQIGFVNWQTKQIVFRGSDRERYQHLDAIKEGIQLGEITQLSDDQPYCFDEVLTEGALNYFNQLGYQVSYQRLQFDRTHNLKIQALLKRSQMRRH